MPPKKRSTKKPKLLHSSQPQQPPPPSPPPPPPPIPGFNPFTKLPSELLSMVFSYLTPTTVDLHRLILIDKWMYETFIPQLYRTLKIDSRTASRIFKGIDHSLENSQNRNPKEKENGDTHTKEQVETPASYGLDPLSIHQRKIQNLQHTTTLKIVSWEGAKATASALGLKNQWRDFDASIIRNSIDGKANTLRPWYKRPYGKTRNQMFLRITSRLQLFKEVDRISFGRALLRSNNLQPYDSRDVIEGNEAILAHPVIRTFLFCLNPKHFCVEDTGENSAGDDTLMRYLGTLAMCWKLESMTWHYIKSKHNQPFIPLGLPLARFFLGSGYEDNSAAGHICIHCHRRTVGAIAMYHSQPSARKKPQTQAAAKIHDELIALPCLSRTSVEAHRITKDGFIIQDGDNGLVPHTDKCRHTVNITGHFHAEPCTCCGRK
ncbi:hypothetical protein IAT40_004295 [Kwoniella sp. CBS 6097]